MPALDAWDQRLAKFAVRRMDKEKLHPNHLTTLGLCLGLGAALLYATGIGFLAHIGAAVFVAAVWMDHVDGEFARASGKTSKIGHYYDHVSAFVGYVSIFVGIGYGLSGDLGSWTLPAGIVAGFAIAITFLVRVVVEERMGKDLVVQENFLGFEMEDALYVVAPITWIGGLKWLLIAAATVAPVFMVFVLWQTWNGRNATGGWSR
jgi:phosphatidylglycerophosphate synthase